MELGSLDAHTLIRLDIKILDSDGCLIFEDFFDAAVPENCGMTPRIPLVKNLDISIKKEGKFQIQVSSGKSLLADYKLEFRIAIT